MSPIKVGIIGYGFAAKNFHIPFISNVPDLEIIAILQRAQVPDGSSATPGTHCKLDFPSVRHYRSADEFFADPDIDLVVVATQHDTHASFAEQALRAGKHVVVDKPFAESSDQANHVIDLAEKKNLIVTCYQNRRWDGDFQTLRDLKERGALGDVKEAEIHYDWDSPSWLEYMTAEKFTPGEGMGFGLGPHSIDQAIVLFGTPKSVTAFNRVQRGIKSEVEDSFTIILQYDEPQQDLLVTVKTSVTSPMHHQLKHFVRGTKGSWIKFQKKSTCSQEDSIANGIKVSDPEFGLESEAVHGTLTTLREFDPRYQSFDQDSEKYTGRIPTKRGHWSGLYQNLADAINGKGGLEVKATQSRDGLKILELARESHIKGATIQWH
ncbi:hypothetical protein CEP51_013892 [Fusarium floridanum]|uniref:Gfo/Idh/MocA-like oxidoreductase N-terminal domain-containing protein n=1 Tax=Fusarium floridanum TaxID=1325733 RepID=A0A428Q2S0_9HYPO|nr:hypothetical protein CEP51_013892 [Fusarium floridanum]